MEQKKKDIDNLIRGAKENISHIVDEINDDILGATKVNEIEQILDIKIDECESIYDHIYKYVITEICNRK